MTIYGMKWYQGKKGKWKRKGLSKRTRGNCKMTLKSGRISSDFELFNEILDDVESNKREDEEFFSYRDLAKEKEIVTPEHIVKNKRYEKNEFREENDISPYETALDSLDDPDQNNNNRTAYKETNSGNSTSNTNTHNKTVVGDGVTEDNDEQAYYDDSDFESISSNDGTESNDSDYESSKRSSRSDKSSARRSYTNNHSSNMPSKSSVSATSGGSTNNLQKDIRRRNDLTENPSEMFHSNKPEEDNVKVGARLPNKRSCLKSGKLRNSSDNYQKAHTHDDKEMQEEENNYITSKKGRKLNKLNKMKRAEELFKLRRNEDIYKMYRQTNFCITEDLWQSSDPSRNKRTRSKSAAAPSQLKSGKQSREASRSHSLSRGRGRPQSNYEKKSKKINLAFSNGNVCRRVDDRVEDSDNPVLLSWLDSKKRIANHQNKIQKQEKKLQRFEDKQKNIKAYQRTVDSSEKVKQWMDEKKKLDKQKRLQRNDLLEKLKFDTINHQRRLVSPMFVRNHFCDMNPAVIDQLKQKTNRNMAPLKDRTNKITSPPDNKDSRETFFKYYLNDPVCPKGYASIRSFTDSVLQDAAKEIARDMAVKVRRFTRGKTFLPLSELNQCKEEAYKNTKAKLLTAKPPLPPRQVNASVSLPHLNDIDTVTSDHPRTPETIRKCIEESNRLKEEKGRKKNAGV